LKLPGSGDHHAKELDRRHFGLFGVSQRDMVLIAKAMGAAA
jgi:hypothetical protein